MKTDKHTTGPWMIGQPDQHPCVVQWEDNNFVLRTIADCGDGGIPQEEKEANALLIAAAPELLEALCDMVSDHDDLSDATLAFARAAIAKARGEG